MSRGAVAAWGAGSLIVVGAAAGALIGLRWWVAAAVVVVVWAIGTGWLAYRMNRYAGVGQGAGSVLAERIRGSVTTKTTIEGRYGLPPVGVPGKDGGNDVLSEGAVRARAIGGDVSTRTNLRASPPASGTPPADPGSPAVR